MTNFMKKLHVVYNTILKHMHCIDLALIYFNRVRVALVGVSSLYYQYLNTLYVSVQLAEAPCRRKTYTKAMLYCFFAYSKAIS
jgi:hypothetical protein